MKKTKSLIAFAMTLVIMAFSVSAYAVTESSHYTSTAGTAGSFRQENTYSVTSTTLATLGGGDIGVYFYSTSIGLQSSFVRSNSRTVTAKVYEEDTSGTHVRTREGTFTTVNGLYRPTLWSYTYTNSGTVEGDPTAELYLTWKVSKISGDTSVSVPAGLMEYSFWVN